MEFIFVHIRKTGGLSFKITLRPIYGGEFLVHRVLGMYPYQDKLLYTDYDACKARFDQAMKQVPPDVKWLSDHVPAQLYDGLFPGVPRITWLRDPVPRVVSAYIYDLFQKIIEPDCSIHEYIRCAKNQNVMTFFTAGGDLDRFSFVGITERFNQSVARLAQLWDWPPDYPIKHINVCSHPKLKEEFLSDSALVSEIERLNQQDRELYTRATEKEM